jgi:putative hydrolase of the HAD superfamily
MLHSKIRAVFFDAGNTLIFPRLAELARDLTAQGLPTTVGDFDEAERSGKQKLDAWLWPKIRAGEVPRAVDKIYWSEYMRALMERSQVLGQDRECLMSRVADGFRDIRFWSRVLPDTLRCLDALRAQGYYLGVISNSVGTIEEHLGHLDLGQRFNTILDSAIVGVEKPHPEIFQMALARAGVEASQALFVGDVYAIDIGGAELAGIRGVLMDRVGAYPDARCPRLTSLDDLESLLSDL